MNYHKVISHLATFGWMIAFVQMESFKIISFRKVFIQSLINPIDRIKPFNYFYCSFSLMVNYITVMILDLHSF